MRQGPVFESGIDVVAGHLFFGDDNDASVCAEVRRHGSGQAQPGPAQDWIPEPQPSLPAVAGEHRTSGVERRVQAAVGSAFEGCLPGAGGGIPEVNLREFPVVAWCRQGRTIGAPGDSCDERQPDRSDEPSGLSLHDPATGVFPVPVSHRDLAAVPAEGQILHLRRPGPAVDRLAGRHIEQANLAITTTDGDPAGVRVELGDDHIAWLVQYGRAPVDVPDRQGTSGLVRGRQVAAVRAHAEHEDLEITTGLEVGDLLVIGHAADLDRPVAKPEGIAGHRRVKGDVRHSRGPGDVPARLLHVRKGQTGDRLVAECVESLCGEFQLLGDCRCLLQGFQRLEPLSHVPAHAPRLPCATSDSNSRSRPLVSALVVRLS